MRTALLAVVAVAALHGADDGWTVILDADSFATWKLAPGDGADTVVDRAGVKEIHRPGGSARGSWTFADGVLTGRGDTSHLFSPRDDYADLAFKAEVKISDGGNSGMCFRAKFGNGWPDGYEAQINATMGDPQKTGSLYGIAEIDRAPVGPETWFTQEVDAIGDHIVIRVNDAVVVNTLHGQRAKGHVAFQQHDASSVVQIRDVRVKELKPADDAALPKAR